MSEIPNQYSNTIPNYLNALGSVLGSIFRRSEVQPDMTPIINAMNQSQQKYLSTIKTLTQEQQKIFLEISKMQEENNKFHEQIRK